MCLAGRAACRRAATGRREHRLDRLVACGRALLLVRPDPLTVRPEPEQGAEHDAGEQRHVRGELAGLAEHVHSEPEASQLDGQANAVEEEEKETFTAHRCALAVAEGPVAVGDVGEHGGDERGDDVRLQPADGSGRLKEVGAAVGDDEADESDDAELGALMDELPETLIQSPGTIHPGWPPFDWSSRGAYPRSHASKHRAQDYRASQVTWSEPVIHAC